MKSTFATIGLGVLALVGTSCRKDSPAVESGFGPDVVAMVAGRPVTRAALEKELARRGPDVTKEAVLADLIRFEATLAKARAAGFDRDPATVAALEHLLVARFEERELAGAESPAVTDDEIRARYEADALRYVIPAAARGGVILLKISPKADAGSRTKVAKLAEELRAQAQTGDNTRFERLVREHSDDRATRYQRGDTGWLNAAQSGEGWDTTVVEALFALRQPGDCAPVIETPGGYHIVRLSETRPAGMRPLAEVAETIRHRLQLEKREQLTAAFNLRMRSNLDIRTNLAAFDKTLATARNDIRPPSVP